jgi:predicted membrane-bound spermidine synthase
MGSFFSNGKSSNGPVAYEEHQPWGSSIYELVPGSYVSFHTRVQLVEFITNPTYGRMLFLDNVLQSTRSDQHIYHESLANAVQKPLGNVLIAGGAEGDLAALCLARGAKRVTMVDWDSELVAHIRNKEEWNKQIWTDPRFCYTSKDIVIFCEETAVSFDTVFLDLLDVNSANDTTEMSRILDWIGMVREPNSTLVMNIGRSYETAKRFAQILGPQSNIQEMSVPSFQETWYFVVNTR